MGKIDKEIREFSYEGNSPSLTITEREPKSRFLIKSGNKFIFKDVKEVAYFFAEGKYVYLVSTDFGKYLVDHTLEKLDQSLDRRLFFRVKRNLIIKIDTIKEFINYRGGRLKLFLFPAPVEDVIVSRERVVEFKRWVDY